MIRIFKKWRTRNARCIFIAVIVLSSLSMARSQEVIQSFTPQVDTSYINLLYDDWSLRLLGVFKYQNIIFSNGDGETIKYLPNDRTSVGVGFAYKFLVVDVGIRLLLNQEELTSRFDLQGDLAFSRHFVNVFIQRYKGFDEANSPSGVGFRDDIRSWIGGLNYFYNFNHKRVSIRSIFTGNRKQKKSAGTFLAGGYFSMQNLHADSSIVSQRGSEFNSFAQITDMQMLNAGITGGYGYIWVLPRNFFIFGALMPGIGINAGDVEAETNYDVKIGPSGKIHGKAALGHIAGRFYSGVTYSVDYFINNIGKSNLFRYNVGKLKVVFGYRLRAKGTVIENLPLK